MHFIVPQFIERKPKIVGPMTFNQFIFIGATGAICIFLYFTLSALSLNTRIILCVFILGAGAALAFVKIGKEPLPTVIKNFFFYMIGPKVYLWKKRVYISPVFSQPKKKKLPEKEEKKESELKIVHNSRLKELATYIETKQK